MYTCIWLHMCVHVHVCMCVQMCRRACGAAYMSTCMYKSHMSIPTVIT